MIFKKKPMEEVIVNALEDVKGQNIVVFDTKKKSSFFDCVIIASGMSNRQNKALAKSVVERVKKYSNSVVGVEGLESAEWVLIDCGDIVCHVMHPAVREYYDLEGLWGS